MSTNRRAAACLRTLCVVAFLIPLNGCSDVPLETAPALGNAVGWVPRAAGTVEIVWPGGKGKVIPPGEEKLAFADVAIFDATSESAARGAFVYRVLNADSSLHREIVAEVTGAVVDTAVGKAWMIGVVVSDTKICSGGGHDGGGCSGDDGGCSHDDGSTHDDGGCSGSDGGMGGGDTGGCTGDDGTTHDDGGCSGSDGGMGGGDAGGGCSGDDGTTHDDGGCSGSDGGMGGGDEGGCSGGDGHGGAGGVPGNTPRVGQIVVLKLHDRGTPGFSDDGVDTNDDGITWKWFLPDNPMLPTIDTYETWSHLCKKTIIGGNLTVHTSK